MPFDLLIHNAQVVTESAVERLDVAIENEKIVDLAAEIHGSAKQTIDAENLHLFPGVIDSHVHLNDAGATDPKDRADWEGVPSGSAAFAAGGGTCFFDMPLNSVPPTLDAASFVAKLSRCRTASHTDFALWGGLTPKNLDHLEALADRGVIGFKAFMTNSGIPDFLACDDDSLLKGMRIAAKLNLPVALHAEDEALTARLTAEARNAGKSSVRAYLDSRPVEAELLAIRKAIAMARETRCRIHIVHVSGREGIAEIFDSRRSSRTGPLGPILITAETCPHYLLLNDKDVERLGPSAKCSPPIRSELNRKALINQLLNGFDTIGSDHSPAPANLKTSSDFFEVWGGVSSIQLTLRAMLSLDMPETAIPLEPRVARLLSYNPAFIFNLPNKGRIAQGCDADLTLIDLRPSAPLTQDQLLDRHKLSPYLGRTLRGKIRQTILRGRTIFENGKITAPPAGQFLRPTR